MFSDFQNKDWWYLSGIFSADGYLDKIVKLPWEKIMWKTGRYLPRLCLPSIHLYHPVNLIIEPLEKLVEKIVGRSYKVIDCFGNYYRDGNDYLPNHSDDYECLVASVTFGTARLFRFVDIASNKVITPKFYLGDGDVFIFTDRINKLFLHGIPRQKSVKDHRVSLTFFLAEF